MADVLENILARRSPWRLEVDSAKKSHVLRQNRSPLIRSRQHLIWGLLDEIVVGTDVEEIADTSSGQCRRRARHQLAAERELVTHACCIYSTVPLLQPFFNDGINALVGAAFASRSLAIPSSARPVAHRGRTKRFDLSGISHDAPPLGDRRSQCGPVRTYLGDIPLFFPDQSASAHRHAGEFEKRALRRQKYHKKQHDRISRRVFRLENRTQVTYAFE